MADRRIGAGGTALIGLGLVAVLALGSRSGTATPPRPCSPGADDRVAVLMLSTSWCGYCKAARRYLAAQALDWCELDIETSTRGAEWHAAVGGRGVPVFVAGDRVMHGFSKRSFADWLAAEPDTEASAAGRARAQ